jgi:uncharacterized membrane protein
MATGKTKIFRYFFRGLLFIVPLALTVYILLESIQWLDGLIPVKVPGLGLLIIVVTITLFGYLGSTLLVKPFFDIMERLIIKLPLANIIYTSLKDLMVAFVGDKRKFSKAVMVVMNKDFGIHKLGFITQEDLSHLGMPGKVAVYLPHSYNFSGNLFIVPKENVIPIEAPGADVMKFIVSGGVAGLDPNKLDQDKLKQ